MLHNKLDIKPLKSFAREQKGLDNWISYPAE